MKQLQVKVQFVANATVTIPNFKEYEYLVEEKIKNGMFYDGEILELEIFDVYE